MARTPEHLISTVALINRAYPDEILEKDYANVLRILYGHMSDRNLADAISLATGKDSDTVYNDVLRIGMKEFEMQETQIVTDRLLKAGLQAWVDKE